MQSSRLAPFRLSLRGGGGRPLRVGFGNQRRWAQVHDVRFLNTNDAREKVYDKYREKLDKKAREMGVGSVDALKRRFQDQKKPTHPTSPESESRDNNTNSPFPPPPPPPRQPSSTSSKTSAGTAPPGVKTLSSFLDLPKTQVLPAKEIETLWRLRHASSPRSLCAIIPTPLYRRIEATARAHPQFILPIPRELSDGAQDNKAGGGAKSGGGAEIHFLQWTFPTPETSTILFTHLAEYKARGEYSQPHTTVTHHLELADDKGLVLLQGQVAADRGVSVDDGKWLLMCLQKFYGGVGAEADALQRGRLLRQFSSGDAAFRIEELIEEADKVV